MTKNRRHDIVKPSKFKTSLCSFFLTAEGCPFGDKCAFAHGEAELRPEVPGEAGDGAGGAETSGRHVGAVTPSSPDSEHMRSGHGHKTAKLTGTKRGPQTGIVLNNMARNVTAGSMNAAAAATGLGVPGAVLPVNAGAGAPAGAYFGAAVPQATYAPYYAPPPGTSHVPFMALNNNQHPVNTMTGPVSMGFDGMNAAAYGLMLQSPMPPPPPPLPATHKPLHAAAHRVPVVSSNTMAAAGLHRHGMMPLAPPLAPYHAPPPHPSAAAAHHHSHRPHNNAGTAPGMIMLPFTAHQGQAPRMSADQADPTAFAVPERAGTNSTNSTNSASAASPMPPARPSTSPPVTSAWSEADGSRLSFQALMASAAPPTVVHIPLGAPQLGRVTPPSGVADAVGSWPSTAAANMYYLSQDPQSGEKNVFLSSLLQQVGGAAAATTAGGAGQFGAVGAAAVDAEEDTVDWSRVLESWTRNQMREDEETAAVAAASSAAAAATRAAPVPAPAAVRAEAVAPVAAAVQPAPARSTPVVTTNMKPVVLAFNSPVMLDGPSATTHPAVPAATPSTTTTTTPTPVPNAAPTASAIRGEETGNRKRLLCSVVRGAHTAGISVTDNATPSAVCGSPAEPDEQSVLLYNPQRNTVYYITRSSTGRPSERPHEEARTEATARDEAGLTSTTGTDKVDGEKAATLSAAGSHESSQSEHGQSGQDAATPKTELLAPQSFRCRPGKKKFLVMGEEESDDDADYCI